MECYWSSLQFRLDSVSHSLFESVVHHYVASLSLSTSITLMLQQLLTVSFMNVGGLVFSRSPQVFGLPGLHIPSFMEWERCLGCPRVFRLVFTTTNSSGSTQKDDSSVQWNPSVEFRESLAPVFINRKTNQVFKHRHPLAHFAYSELKTWCDIFIYLRWRDLHDCVCSTNSLNSLAPGASVSLQSINCISNLFLRGGSDTQNSH